MHTVKKRVTKLAAMLLVASGLVMTQGLTSPANAAEILLDGGFEAGASGDSPNWTEADSSFGTPLCTDADCGTGGGASPPHAGTVWAWFGGVATAGHTGSLSQTLVIPSGTASLTYWYRNGTVTTPFTATLTVKVDGTTVKTHTEAAVAEAAYSLQTVDISAFANGASHTLSFNYLNGATGTNSMVVDDVSIDSTPSGVVTATPTVTSATPAGPSSSLTTSVVGTAEAGSTVTLYGNNTCTGGALGTGSAADFSSTGITATVPANATTTIYAKASKTAQLDSLCSSTFVSYTNDSAAPAAPTVDAVAPASPGASTSPSVTGTAEAGSTVKLYTSADCSGSPAATGTAADFGSTGITATVAVGSTTTFKATATDAVGNASACSASSVTYTQQTPAPPAPNTTLTKTPPKKIKTTKKKAKVSFSFTSSIPGATFQCSKDGGAFVACTSGISYKAKIGKHTFAVRAVNAGVPDASPATYSFKVKKKKKK
jgi:hypothetical protein